MILEIDIIPYVGFHDNFFYKKMTRKHGLTVLKAGRRENRTGFQTTELIEQTKCQHRFRCKLNLKFVLRFMYDRG